MDNQIRSFEVCDDYLWVNLIKRARLMNLYTGESWYYSENDGIQGNQMYHIGCESDWVWFVANEGISLYNWSRYHEK